jgi:hypothetical protein
MGASVEGKTFLGEYLEEIIMLTADHSDHF